MPGCLPPRYRLLDLLFAVWGAAAFLLDLGSDVWSAVRYWRAGDTAWAALYIGLFLLSSAALQLLSWGWFWADWRELHREDGAPGSSGAADTDYVQRRGRQAPEDGTSNGRQDGRQPGDASDVTSAVGAGHVRNGPPETAHGGPDATATLDPAEGELVGRRFCTGRVIFQPSCFTLLHVLQLGYPLRCIHSLEVGIAAYRNPKDDDFKDYAYFLTHDLSMMRLMETFMENTPQLILVLYIIIQREAIHAFQGFSISMSFICISWAILDYHQSLRLFLKGKQNLSSFSSAVYYSWNFCLISARILCVTLFTVTFHWMIALHFLLLWIAFFLWATLQKTTFMKHRSLELVYRATVAVILYFSWFNIADGRTVYRCTLYYLFIAIDSAILLLSWRQYKFPSILDMYEIHMIITTLVFFGVGLLLRLLYYKFLHPNVRRETKQYFDVPDGVKGAGTSKTLVSAGMRGHQTNDRMKYLAERTY